MNLICISPAIYLLVKLEKKYTDGPYFLSLNPEVANQRHLLDLGRDRIRQSPPKQTKQLSDKNIK